LWDVQQQNWGDAEKLGSQGQISNNSRWLLGIDSKYSNYHGTPWKSGLTTRFFMSDFAEMVQFIPVLAWSCAHRWAEAN